MSAPTDEPLSAQQMQQISKQHAEQLQRALDHLGLRKQCLEMAVRSTGVATPPAEVMALARQMYEFLIEPVREIKIVIGG